MKEKLRIAVVGLGFGAEFIPIYLYHPNVEHVAICDSDPDKLKETGDKFEIEHRVGDFRSVVESNEFDAVHIVTGFPLHAEQSIAVLNSGKHCACTVPMAMTLDDLRTIIRAEQASGKRYMMMETALYTTHFLYVKELLAEGKFGRVQFLRGAHYQDMENWPVYWTGLPPMHYATHALAPVIAAAGRHPATVHCFGSGKMREDLTSYYGNPFPVETAIYQFEGSELAAEVTRTLFHTSHGYTESFNVYGETMTFEWQQLEEEEPVVFEMEPLEPGRRRPITARRISPPDRADLLPEPIRRFTKKGVYDASTPHLSFFQGGGHGGSHPHLVNEFVSSIIEERKPAVDSVTAAVITAAGICAHQSAMLGGKEVAIPSFV